MVRYTSGKPCAKGHFSERYAANNRCCECDRAYQSEYRNGGTRVQRPVAAHAMPSPAGTKGHGFTEPLPWAFDGCKRREPVLDDDYFPPRIVRHVGWRACLRCARPFWSVDVVKNRLCPSCKGVPE